jgi:predicted lipoprotein with Yx(FWY)xxD motif
VVSKIFNKLTTRLLVLGMLALVAVVGTAGSSAAAPAGGQAAGDTHASSTLTVRNTRYGRILFDGGGRALYAFTRDRRGGRSRCYAACAKKWPVYFAKGRPLAGAGARQSLVGTGLRRDGRRQISYNGRPLYYYVGDKSPGQILCQKVNEFGGTWLVVHPNGQLVR